MVEFLHVCMLEFLHAWSLACLSSCMLEVLHVCMLEFLNGWVLACLHAWVLAFLHGSLLASVLTWLPRSILCACCLDRIESISPWPIEKLIGQPIACLPEWWLVFCLLALIFFLFSALLTVIDGVSSLSLPPFIGFIELVNWRGIPPCYKNFIVLEC